VELCRKLPQVHGRGKISKGPPGGGRAAGINELIDSNVSGGGNCEAISDRAE
jgi:hypothetical protein